MKTKTCKILCFVLAMLMICSCFLVSCSSEQKEEGKVDEIELNTQEVDESKIYDAEIKDLNKHVLRVYTVKSSHLSLNTHEVYAEQPNGDKVNDAVYSRNSQLELKYNFTIEENKQARPTTVVKESLIAGEYICDLIYEVPYYSRSLASSNLLVDIGSLENIDLSKAWWDQNAQVGLNVGGKTFFVTGDASTKDDRAAFVVWYNRDIIETYDSSINLYDEVREGKWTVDRLYQLMTSTAQDLDGDNILTPGQDRMGVIAERYCNYGLVCSSGVTIGNVDDAGNWEIPVEPKQELLDVWAALKPVITSPTRWINATGGDEFRSGQATFSITNMGSALSMNDTYYQIGFLPMPKATENQDKYYTGVYFTQIGCYSIPTTVEGAEDWATNGFSSGAEQAAYMLEAFAYYSMNILTPAFYNQVLLKQAVKDTDSVEMVELALANKVYDPILGYNFGGINIFNKVGSNNMKSGVGTDVNYDTLVSTYNSRVIAARKALTNYINYVNFEAGNEIEG